MSSFLDKLFCVVVIFLILIIFVVLADRFRFEARKEELLKKIYILHLGDNGYKDLLDNDKIIFA